METSSPIALQGNVYCKECYRPFGNPIPPTIAHRGTSLPSADNRALFLPTNTPHNPKLILRAPPGPVLLLDVVARIGHARADGTKISVYWRAAVSMESGFCARGAPAPAGGGGGHEAEAVGGVGGFRRGLGGVSLAGVLGADWLGGTYQRDG
jgi:hypothetical protein